MTKFYFANEGIDRDMSYEKYKLKKLHYAILINRTIRDTFEVSL